MARRRFIRHGYKIRHVRSCVGGRYYGRYHRKYKK